MTCVDLLSVHCILFSFGVLAHPGAGENSGAGAAQPREEENDQTRPRVGHGASEQTLPAEFREGRPRPEALWDSERLENANRVSVEVFGRLCSALTRPDSV